MRKFLVFFIVAMVCLAGGQANAANVSVKKASSVKKQETSGIESVTNNSLLPGVIGLVSNVAALKKQTDELKAECYPSQTEINWVNDMVKEYAKIGAVSADDMVKLNGGAACGGESYELSVQTAEATHGTACVPTFDSTDDLKRIWAGYPKVAAVKICPELGDTSCSASKKKNISNIYTIFGQLGFDEADYLESEASMFVKMMEKADKCAPEKISAKQREAYAGFLQQTITGAGQSTNTGAVYEAIGNLTKGGGGLSGIGTLAPTVAGFLDK